MQNFGGFEHNLQSLRVVDQLELRYAEFDGLNLTFEVREGILKHCSIKNAKELGDVGVRFIEKKQPSLEAQLTNYADEIAYNNHDIDDGLRSGLITIEQLEQVELFALNLELVRNKYPKLENRRLIHETIRRMINILVVDLCEQSTKNIELQQPQNSDQIRQLPQLINFSNKIAKQNLELKQFLRNNLYHHYKVNRMSAKAVRIVTELFECFIKNTGLLPTEFQDYARIDKARAVADYIAGMTDRYAIREHRRLFAIDDTL
jgi:dGTPase